MKIALIIALALATPAKEDTPAKDDTPAQDDMRDLYIALTTRQCGKTRGVIWMRMDGKDFYVTGETRVNGTFPRLSGNYVFNGEELTRNGKPCKRVTSELPPDEAKSDAAMLEDRFGLPTDPQWHIERRDEAEAASALVVPVVIVRVERKVVAYFLEPARKLLARDDAASNDAARARLFADAAHCTPTLVGNGVSVVSSFLAI